MHLVLKLWAHVLLSNFRSPGVNASVVRFKSLLNKFNVTRCDFQEQTLHFKSVTFISVKNNLIQTTSWESISENLGSQSICIPKRTDLSSAQLLLSAWGSACHHARPAEMATERVWQTILFTHISGIYIKLVLAVFLLSWRSQFCLIKSGVSPAQSHPLFSLRQQKDIVHGAAEAEAPHGPGSLCSISLQFPMRPHGKAVAPRARFRRSNKSGIGDVHMTC